MVNAGATHTHSPSLQDLVKPSAYYVSYLVSLHRLNPNLLQVGTRMALGQHLGLHFFFYFPRLCKFVPPVSDGGLATYQDKDAIGCIRIEMQVQHNTAEYSQQPNRVSCHSAAPLSPATLYTAHISESQCNTLNCTTLCSVA